jgi:predicted GNAT family N-acyltransferase
MDKVEIYRFDFSEKPDLYKSSLQIREKVFIEGQNVDPAIEIENEEEARHYLLLFDSIPVSTARWRVTEKGIKLERFATLEEYRSKGLGGMILKAVMDDVIPLGKQIYLHSQAAAVNFYLGHGFEITGDKFFEADIEHYPMRYVKSKNPL